jgi:hypothetical protein
MQLRRGSMAYVYRGTVLRGNKREEKDSRFIYIARCLIRSANMISLEAVISIIVRLDHRTRATYVICAFKIYFYILVIVVTSQFNIIYE